MNNKKPESKSEPKAIQALRARLSPSGVKLDVTDYTIHCDAPAGYTWRATGTTCLSIHYGTNSESWLVQAIREEMDSIKMGLEKCTDSAELAEHQHNLDYDNWKAADDAPMTIAIK